MSIIKYSILFFILVGKQKNAVFDFPYLEFYFVDNHFIISLTDTFFEFVLILKHCQIDTSSFS